MSTRSRRSNAGQRRGASARAAALDRLAAVKGQKSRRVSQYEVAEDDNIYDRLDETEYQNLMRQRQEEEDFVVDDLGIGYTDTGGEIFDDIEAEQRAQAPRRHKGKKLSGIALSHEKARKAKAKAPKKRVNAAFLKAARGGGGTRSQMGDSIGPGISAGGRSKKSRDTGATGTIDLESMLASLNADPLDVGTTPPSHRPRTASSHRRATNAANVALFGSETEAQETSYAHYSSGAGVMRLPTTASSRRMMPDRAATTSDDPYNVVTAPTATMDLGMADTDVDMATEMGMGLEVHADQAMPMDVDGAPMTVSEAAEATKSREGKQEAQAQAQEQEHKPRKVMQTDADLDAERSSAGSSVGAAAAAATLTSASSLPQAPQRVSNVRISKKGRMVRRKRKEEANAAALVGPAGAPKAHMHAGDGLASSKGGDWWSVCKTAPEDAESAAPAAAAGVSSGVTPRQADGGVLLYYTDAYEEQYSKSGIVYLFGKVRRDDGSYGSCCVKIRNLERSIYFLPRALDPTDPDVDNTDREEIATVYNEVHDVLKKHGISKFKSRPAVRRYAFELADVPAETTYLEVVQAASGARLPADLEGHSFSRVFGTQTTALEGFLTRIRLMGPGWLYLGEAADASQSVSWAKYELEVVNPRSIVKVETDEELLARLEIPANPPPLKVMSLSLKTVLNAKAYQNEVVAMSAIVHDQVLQDTATLNPEAQMTHFSAVRPLDGMRFPFDFAPIIGNDARLRIKPCSSERGLLSYLLAKIHTLDPDVIVGHNVIGFDLDILLHRMKALKVHGWSKLGRLRRKKMPTLQSGPGGTGNSTRAELAVAAGRLMCDTWIGAKDLIREKNYSLTHLAKVRLGVDRASIDMGDIPEFFRTTPQLIDLIRHCENDAYLSLKIMFNLELIPLSRQLTALAGNLWSQTLQGGGRSLRNEYLLLHEFTELGYIVPDKYWRPKKTGGAGRGAGEVGGGKKKRGKAAYAGGLVLEPKRGFYDKFILLLDFNSLYPSIIQEYNLCFTTVKRKKGTLPDGSNPEEEAAAAAAMEMAAAAGSPYASTTQGGSTQGSVSGVGTPDRPEAMVPSDGTEAGVLPRLIRTLVEQRKVVKGLLKRETDPLKKNQYDIRQKALKLTANSMYGCLGFVNSRFYCKPVAALITSLGRDILKNTANLAEEKLNLDVVYGDTDSIMVNTGSTDLDEARLLARSVKQEVNKLYKLLELDLDGIFKSMLLLKKKKYAALMIHERDGIISTVKEVKGLDLVRRDWCELSKEAGHVVLDLILSGREVEDVVEAIHDYLSKLNEDIRNHRIVLAKYIITKGLTKDPRDYADAKGQPHVQVAMRMRQQGKIARAGDYIPYVICKRTTTTADADPTKPITTRQSSSYADRAYHPDEVLHSDGQLVVDIDWYLAQQLHPPVSRLCEPIQGTDPGQIADCLGLDSSRFNRVFYSESGNAMFDKTAAADARRFKDCDPLVVKCGGPCGHKHAFDGVFRFDEGTVECGLRCNGRRHMPENLGVTDPTVAGPCGTTHTYPRIVNAFTLAVRKHLRRYYDAWYVCDDESCGNRTRQMSLRGSGRQCLIPVCSGTMHPEYSPSDLYTQLLYYQSLFDVDHALEILSEEEREIAASALSPADRGLLATLKARVDQELGKCAHYFVDLGVIFSAVSEHANTVILPQNDH